MQVDVKVFFESCIHCMTFKTGEKYLRNVSNVSHACLSKESYVLIFLYWEGLPQKKFLYLRFKMIYLHPYGCSVPRKQILKFWYSSYQDGL